jgi:NAD(P)-dependent dehydrogenase (short-subunit alcohol dehydrogenase family)
VAGAYPLTDKVVFVTGAARGIGAECARRCAQRGAKVALVGLEPEELERVAADCGPDAAWFEADVTDRESLGAAVEGTVERFGGIDVCISNAGIAGGGPVRLVPAEAIERIVEINLLGSMRTLSACLPHVVERRGYLLQIASLAAVVHSPGMSGYSTSKAGIEAFANCLRAEVHHLGVGVGVGYFSWIDTDLVRGADDRRGYRELRSRLRGPMATTHPVSAVGDAVLEGIESKSRWVVVPRWARVMLFLRQFVQLLSEAQGKKNMPEFEEIARAELAEIGADRAGEPVGPGGAAATAAARARSLS